MLSSQKGRGHYDRFRSRIVFPIRDARGRVQGFGARALLPDQKPKYVNSPEGELYSKRRTLYGIERARPQIVKSGRALVVEGYTDVIACHQAGIARRRGDHGHGDHARAGEAALRLRGGGGAGAGRRPRRARGDAARADGGRQARCGCGWRGCRRARTRRTCSPAATGRAPNAFRDAIEAAEDLPVFHVHTLLDDGDLTSPAGRDRALDEVVEVIAAMPDSITREELMREVADRLDADPGPGRAADRGAPGGSASRRAAEAAPADRARRVGRARRTSAPRALNARERRELGAAGDVRAAAGRGRATCSSRLTDAALLARRSRRGRARWIARPPRGSARRASPRDDEELFAYVTDVKMRAERGAGERRGDGAQLPRARAREVDDEIAAAEAERRARRSSSSAGAPSSPSASPGPSPSPAEAERADLVLS